MSVALVIDQSMTFDKMAKVNNSLGALQGAFTPYDEVAVFTYNNGPKHGDGLYGSAECAADAGDWSGRRRPAASRMMDSWAAAGAEHQYQRAGSVRSEYEARRMERAS